MCFLVDEEMRICYKSVGLQLCVACKRQVGGLLDRTFPVLPSPSYTTPFSTNHSQYENAPFNRKYAITAGAVYAFVASQPSFQSK